MAIAMSPQKVLVVDDEDHILELARLYLSREGYQIETVTDGANALARFGQVKPDLVVLDIMLPNVDGLTICREIRKTSQVPIIMLTARDEVTDKVVGLELGADDYLCCWRATRAACSSAASCWTWCGGTTSPATRGRSTSTCSSSVRS